MRDIIKKYREILYKILILLLTVVLIYSVCQIVVYFYDLKRNKNVYNDIKSVYYQKENTDAVTDSNQGVIEKTTGNESKAEITLNKSNIQPDVESLESTATSTPLKRQAFSKLKAINKDIVGWIRIPSTQIDYPVLQSKDNEYYLTHSVTGEVIRNASIFLDYRNNLSANDFNTIIYGHHMHDGSMFGDLIKYKDQSFFDRHKYIYFDTINGKGLWEIFSVYVTDVRFDYLKIRFQNDEECQKYIDKIVSMSIYKTRSLITPQDKIITLSTCDYKFNNARMVVHAMLVKK